MDHEFHIVLIDDNVHLHDNVRAALNGDRVRVSSAFEPAAGLELLRQQPCDLLLLDLGLPGLDGFEVLARLKADPQTAVVPVIVLTAWDGAVDKERCFELGAVDYVTKPFEARELRARVRSVLKQAQLQRELRRSNRELEAARNRALEATLTKSRFLANMSHEIRTPMNGVIAMTSLLLETPLTAEQRELAETIRTSGQSLLVIIDDILDFSKIEAGKLELDPHPFDLRQCVQEAVALLAPRAAERRIELPVEIDPSLPAQMVGDATRLRQVLVNLLGNGVKFTARGEVALHVAGRPAGSAAIAGQPAHDGPLWELEFTVRDTGIGIPPEKLDRLFESFVQVDASTTRQYGGTGLGLAICKSLVTLMGGRISVESAPGRGSSFRFTARLSAVMETATRTPDAAPVAGLRLLVVDSNPTNRRVIDLNARKWGATTRTATDGPSALELLRGSEPVDAALIDLQAPGLDGPALCREIRRLPGRDQLPLVLLTSLADVRGVAAAAFQTVLTKPLKLPQLLETLVSLRQSPAAPPAPASVPVKPRLEADLAKRLPLRLLLVEDNAINQRVARRALQQMGYDCALAVNGREAVEMSAAQVFDLAFMDVQMPEMDGYEATQRIRARERAGQTPPLVIIGLTANALKGDREKCLDAGLDDYIPKPLELERLQDAIKRWGPLAVARRPATPAAAGQSDVTAAPAAASASPAALPAAGTAAEAEPPADMLRLDEFSSGDPVQLRELVELYLDQTAGQLQQIKDAAARGDQEQVRRVAHSCAGASGTCGMRPIAAVMRELERNAHEGNLAAAPALAAEAEKQYDRLRGYLCAQLAARGIALAGSTA